MAMAIETARSDRIARISFLPMSLACWAGRCRRCTNLVWIWAWKTAHHAPRGGKTHFPAISPVGGLASVHKRGGTAHSPAFRAVAGGVNPDRSAMKISQNKRFDRARETGAWWLERGSGRTPLEASFPHLFPTSKPN